MEKGSAHRRPGQQSTSARSRSTSSTPCGPTGWPRPSPPIGPPAAARASSAPRWARRRRRPSIRCGRSAASAAEHGLWLHVDAALAGTAGLCPEFRRLFDGLELADSYCFNPHKWMFTNFDCDCFFVADRAQLIRTLSILPEYLRNKATESGAVIDYRDWQVPLGRRFRALKLWFVIRSFGVEGLQERIRRHVALAQRVCRLGRQNDPQFELAAPAPLGLVCFRHRGGDAVNQQILDRAERLGPHASDPHAAGRQADAAPVDRADQHRAAARRDGHGHLIREAAAAV